MKNFVFLKAKDVMTRGVVTVCPTAVARELRELFEQYDFNCLPVIEDGRLVGVVTKFDFLKNLIFRPTSMIPDYGDLMERPVSELMTRPPFFVDPEIPLTRLLEIMVETRKRSFPVVDDKEELVGMVTHTDVLRCVR